MTPKSKAGEEQDKVWPEKKEKMGQAKDKIKRGTQSTTEVAAFNAHRLLWWGE